MSLSWQINGVDLTDNFATVNVEPGSLKSTHGLRVQDVNRLHSTPRRHQLGSQFPTYSWRFKVVAADAADRHARIQSIKGTLKSSANFTLTAPDEPNEVFFDGSAKSVILTLDSLSVVYEQGVGMTAIDVVATQLNANDVSGGDTGFSRGQSQVINGVCQTIQEDVLFADVVIRTESPPRSEDLLVAVALLSDAVPTRSEDLLQGEAMLFSFGAPISAQLNINGANPGPP